MATTTPVDDPTTMPPPAPPSSPTAPGGEPAPRRPRGTLVRLALVCTFLVFAACATLLLYRAWTIDVPDSMLIVRGSPAWEGAELTMDSLLLKEPQRAHMTLSARYTISFHLLPGTYTLSVRRGGVLIYTSEFALTRQARIGVLDLPPSPEGLGPATQPAHPKLEFRDPWAN
jgi:hypothetical protein